MAPLILSAPGNVVYYHFKVTERGELPTCPSPGTHVADYCDFGWTEEKPKVGDGQVLWMRKDYEEPREIEFG